MRIDLASRSDAAQLVAIRDARAQWLLDCGIRQWLPGEFPLDRMRRWIDQRAVHVGRVDGQLVAAVAVLWEDPAIWPDDGTEAGYVHLLMTATEHAGSGHGATMLSHAEAVIGEVGRRLARLDAVASNPTLRGWYEQRGYIEVGRVPFDREDWFDTVLLEKRLNRTRSAPS